RALRSSAWSFLAAASLVAPNPAGDRWRSSKDGPTAAQALPSLSRWKPLLMSAILLTRASCDYIRPVSAAKSAKATEWLGYKVGGPKATLLGHVTAPNRETALARAYEEFGITSRAERKRIIVQPTSRT